jgi:hypothetical protein
MASYTKVHNILFLWRFWCCCRERILSRIYFSCRTITGFSRFLKRKEVSVINVIRANNYVYLICRFVRSYPCNIAGSQKTSQEQHSTLVTTDRGSKTAQLHHLEICFDDLPLFPCTLRLSWSLSQHGTARHFAFSDAYANRRNKSCDVVPS